MLRSSAYLRLTHHEKLSSSLWNIISRNPRSPTPVTSAYQSAESRRHHDWQFWYGSRSWTVRIGDMARQVIDHCDVIVDAALAGAGIVYLHDYVVEPYLRNGTLLRVLEEFSTPQRSIHLPYPAARASAPKDRGVS